MNQPCDPKEHTMPSTYQVTDTETGEVREHPATWTAAVRAADYWAARTHHMHVVKPEGVAA